MSWGSPDARDPPWGYHDSWSRGGLRCKRVPCPAMPGTRTICRLALDILTQVNSVTAALNAVGIGLLDAHVRHRVTESIEAGDGEQQVEELMSAVARSSGR